jgi:hypothetical protein
MNSITGLLAVAGSLSGVAAMAFVAGARSERRRNTAMIRRAFAEYRAQGSVTDRLEPDAFAEGIRDAHAEMLRRTDVNGPAAVDHG